MCLKISILSWTQPGTKQEHPKIFKNNKFNRIWIYECNIIFKHIYVYNFKYLVLWFYTIIEITYAKWFNKELYLIITTANDTILVQT